MVEPLPDRPLAVVDTGPERVLALADYHAGIEAALRAREGLSVDGRAEHRRETLCSAVERTDPDRVVVVGDLMHSIGDPGGAERGEIEVLLERVPVPVTLVPGNHDGAIGEWAADLTVADPRGLRIGSVGFAHGHSWPAREVVAAETVCVGHEHPCVRLTDAVGGSRVERAWLRGGLDRSVFEDGFGNAPRDSSDGNDDGDPESDDADADGARGSGGDPAGAESPDGDPVEADPPDGELVVFPAFNDLSGGTWVNADPDFLCPFLPDALRDGEAYLLDGTRLGRYDRV